MNELAKIMLLGSGELGKEFAISAKRLNNYVIAVDRYAHAPAMQVADTSEVINMLDGEALQQLVDKYKPDYIVAEIEAIRTEKLVALEQQGFDVIPSAKAVSLTMNRDAIRDAVANELNIRTPRYAYANSASELKNASSSIGFPCVIKPVMSSSGKGQSIVNSLDELTKAWDYACIGMRGDKKKVILEEYISFESEMTLLTIKQKNGDTLFVQPIGHRQELGDYRESWMPAKISPQLLDQAQQTAKQVTDYLGGAGLFGVEFFVTKDEVIFSELSPRPHDTGMVTLISQDLSEFDLHLRAILGLPIPEISYYGPSASAVILAKEEGQHIRYHGLKNALVEPQTEIRLFGKPVARLNRRMGVALARADSVAQAIAKAKKSASCINLEIKE